MSASNPFLLPRRPERTRGGTIARVVLYSSDRQGYVREFRGLTLPRGERVVELGMVVHGVSRGGSQIGADGAAVVLPAIEAARAGHEGKHGSFRDGRFTVIVTTARHPTEPGVAVYFQRTDDSGAQAAAPITLCGEERDALDDAIGWIFKRAP